MRFDFPLHLCQTARFPLLPATTLCAVAAASLSRSLPLALSLPLCLHGHQLSGLHGFLENGLFGFLELPGGGESKDSTVGNTLLRGEFLGIRKWKIGQSRADFIFLSPLCGPPTPDPNALTLKSKPSTLNPKPEPPRRQGERMSGQQFSLPDCRVCCFRTCPFGI